MCNTSTLILNNIFCILLSKNKYIFNYILPFLPIQKKKLQSKHNGEFIFYNIAFKCVTTIL